MDVQSFLIVGMGGFFGANLRYSVSLLAGRWFPSATYTGTFFVNFTGSLLLAVFMTWAADKATIPPRVRLMIGTGFFGSYTTFSTFANETVTLARMNGLTSAVVYLILTNSLCLLGVLVGLWTANRL